MPVVVGTLVGSVAPLTTVSDAVNVPSSYTFKTEEAAGVPALAGVGAGNAIPPLNVQTPSLSTVTLFVPLVFSERSPVE